ncbi:Putative P-loop containing nucleoside triphosphate hydrolase, DNA2/NAM7 helicase-like protein [Septoria linicola]|uniref:P-loop containing nucleoside triphosphate hydrolase, DNA2/NAM7 helicase-like protein n=1 Tax=Septoria linicola TaxID=215465 RepID=A0A9Q9AYC0_9PEZI|nr:Putative P-loop containing nucleoside triphosphate hydrolase, DNA2/NAM7 helicase-like protein [Septoria linicola]
MASSSPSNSPPLAATLPQQYALPREADAKRTTTTDATSEGGTLPMPQQYGNDPPVYEHLQHIFDADTRGPVTEHTRVTTIYEYNDRRLDNRLLRNLSGLSWPIIRAQWHIRIGGRWIAFPPTLNGRHGYEIFVRFNRLLFAPAFIVEIPLYDSDARLLGRLRLEFPFNTRDSKRLTDFTCTLATAKTGPSSIQFEVSGASLEGFTTVASFERHLTSDQLAIIDIAKFHGTAGKPVTMMFALQTQELSILDHDALFEIISRLPGGRGQLLPSIGRDEWIGFLPDDVNAVAGGTLLTTLHRLPTFGLENVCGFTFTSIEHFDFEQRTAERIANEEGNSAVHVWSQARHLGALYDLDGHAILAIKFGEPVTSDRAGRARRQFKLPDDLEIDCKLQGLEETEITACHERDLMGIQHHTKHNAYFKITSEWTQELEKSLQAPDDPSPTYMTFSCLIPHQNRFWISSVHATCDALARTSRWHSLMLGQSFDDVEMVDVMAGIKGVPIEQKTNAKKWLISSKPWNPEQSRAIESMHAAPAGMSLVTGPKGVGKSTLLVAIATYFVMLNGRALISATENNHAQELASTLFDVLATVRKPDGTPVKAYTKQSLARYTRLSETTAAQAAFKKVGHQDGRVGGLDDYKFAMLNEKFRQSSAWKYSLCNAVHQEADKGELHHMAQLHDSKGRPYGEPVEIWHEFRRLRRDDEHGDIDWTDRDAKMEFRHVYNACEGYLIAHADILIITNPNARCKEIERYWYELIDDYGVEIKALAVLINQAGSAREIEAWNVITARLPRRPDLVMMFGDIQQLGPVNTSADQKPLCNPLVGRLSISLLARLIMLDFPSVNLTEQRFMHSELVHFPSQMFYGGVLTTAAGSDRSLDEVEPGLKTVLQQVLSRAIVDKAERAQFVTQNVPDSRLRLCYINAGEGPVQTNERKSAVVLGHLEIFFAHILPALQVHFQDRTHQEILIIVAYGYARTRYIECMHGLREGQGYAETFYPRIMSIDGSKGHTASMVFFDGSMQYRNRLGFLNDAGRANVAMTRATQIFWIIGGSLKLQYRGSASNTHSAFPRLKEVLQATGKVIDFAPPEMPTTVRRLTSGGHHASSNGAMEPIPDLQLAVRAMGVAPESISTQDISRSDPFEHLSDEHEPESNDAALFFAAVQRLRVPREILAHTIPAPSEPAYSEEFQVAAEDDREESEGNYTSGPTDEERFFRIAGRLRGSRDVPSATSRPNILPEVHENVVEIDVRNTGSDEEAAKFLALASRLRKYKV